MTQSSPQPESTQNQAPNENGALVRSYAVLLLIAIASISLDQWTKNLVRMNLAFGETFVPWPEQIPILRIVHWGNEGAAFGLFQGGGSLFMVLAVVVALLIIFYFPSIDHRSWLIRVAMGLQMGGALGNFLDRVNYGYVTDWLAIHRFYVFNVADSSVTVGAALLILFTILTERRERKQRRQAEADVPSSE